jgi:LDH2 family malate/lactate/ureidoglycolate dehydrogenase
MASLVALDPLQACIAAVLVRLDVAEDEADQIADVLVDAELRGYPDHGVWFLGEVAGWLRSRALNPRPNVQVVRETDLSLLLDGDGGCGVVPSYRAMDWCVQRAKQRGMAMAAIQRSGHFIAAAPFVTRAAEAGCIGIAAANVSPLMAPPGGRTRTLGTNPFAFAAPSGGEFPIVFDMATTATAGFKVRLAARAGRQLEPGLIADAEGQPSQDPRDFLNGGLLLPVGGHKGFGLGLMVEILAGVLSGASFGAAAGVTNGREGHFFLAVDPEGFMPVAAFTERMRELIGQVKSGARAEGIDELFVPGERGQRRATNLRRTGQVPVDDQGWTTLQEVCSSLNVDPPEPISR